MSKLTNKDISVPDVLTLIIEEHRALKIRFNSQFCFRDLPRKPMGGLLRDVYEKGLTGGIHNTREYRQTNIALLVKLCIWQG